MIFTKSFNSFYKCYSDNTYIKIQFHGFERLEELEILKINKYYLNK